MNAYPTTPTSYTVRITHHRRDPLDYRFENRATTWLVDLDELPCLPRGLRWLCRFDSKDHLGDRNRSIRANLDRWLAEANVARPARVLMLANPRVLGYAFNPLTLFYCYRTDGELARVVAEVSNTYGEQHRYLLSLDPSGRAQATKEFYVSPFHPVDGQYELFVPAPDSTVVVVVTLRRPGSRPFTASMTGQRRTVSLWSVLATPLASRAVMAGIKRHGIALYLKGLRPIPRRKAAA